MALMLKNWNRSELWMNRLTRCFFLIVFSVFFTSNVFGQDEGGGDVFVIDRFYNQPEPNNFRTFLNKFSFGFATGYGRTFYKHSLEGFGIANTQNGQFIFPNSEYNGGGTVANGYDQWFSDIKGSSNRTIAGNDFVAKSDTTQLIFKGGGTSIPLFFMLHFEFNRYRIGGGFGLEPHFIGKFKPVNHKNELANYDPDLKFAMFKRYFLSLSANVVQYYEYKLNLDVQIGKLKLGNKFNKALISQGVYYNFGVSAEKQLSEFLHVYVKPAFELKKYTISIPESSNSIVHKQNTFFIQIGFHYKIPNPPKCKRRQCMTQVNHTHGDYKEVRSRAHPVYKWQNPHYGQNYPRMIKYKRKNRRKRNPY